MSTICLYCSEPICAEHESVRVYDSMNPSGGYAHKACRDKCAHIFKEVDPLNGIAGCGAHACCIRRPQGMGTNGPCMCEPVRLRMAIQKLKNVVRELWEA